MKMNYSTNSIRATGYLHEKIVFLSHTLLLIDQKFKYENTVKLSEEIIGDIHIRIGKYFLMKTCNHILYQGKD